MDKPALSLWLCLLVAGGLLALEPAYGQTLGSSDQAAAMENLQNALANGRSGVWVNPDTGNSGDIQLEPARKDAEGQLCREYSQTIFIGEQRHEGFGTACRQPDGSWQIVPTGPFVSPEAPEVVPYRSRPCAYYPERCYDPFYPYPYVPYRLHFGFGYTYGDRHHHHRGPYRHHRHRHDRRR